MPEQKYADDPTIMGEDDLWRRVHPDQVVPDPKFEQGLRPSSGAFRDLELSVDVAKDSTADKALGKYERHSLVAFTSGLARRLNQVVTYDRKSDNQAHALVIGKKPGSVRKELINGSTWVVLQEPAK